MTYLRPTANSGLPGNLNLNQFIQTVLVGLSGIDGTLVRPAWQIAPPKQPDIAVNWIAFGVSIVNPDANAFIGVNEDDSTTLQRHEELDITCSFYGPEAMENATLVRDGFQIEQNRNALTLANMGFKSTNEARHLPDLVNERFINRYLMNIYLRREIQRTYSVPTLISAHGTIHSVIGGENYSLDWDVPEEI